MGSPVLIYNGKTITLPHKGVRIDPNFGPPRTAKRSLTGYRETITVPRVDSSLRLEWPILTDASLRMELENAMQWVSKGGYATFALDSAKAVDTVIAVDALEGDSVFWVNNPAGITTSRVYRIIHGPNAQKVSVSAINADKITISGTLDFDLGAGAIFRDEFFMPIALSEDAGTPIRILEPDEGQKTGEWPLTRFIFAPEFLEDFSQETTMFIKNLAANETGSNVATAQPWFPSLGGITVASDTTYLFEGYLRLSRSAGTTSHTTSLLFGGTAVLNSIAYKAQCNTTDVVVNSAGIPENGVSSEVATAIVVKPSPGSTASEQVGIKITGTVRVTTTGTLIPQFQYSAAPGGAPTILKNSFFMLTSLGAASFATQGTWS